MKVLFVMRNAGYVRNFESVIRTLAERGHRVHLAFEFGRSNDSPELADELSVRYDGVTYSGIPDRDDVWWELAHAVRRSIDCLRYVAPTFHDTPKLRARAERHTPAWLVTLTRLPVFRTWPAARLLIRMLRALDRAIPTARAIDEYVRGQEPDLVLVTPLVAGPWQAEYVRSARKLRRPTALPVYSWDNLTNKGLLRDTPDRVYVWNEIQRREAVELHGVRADRVVVVGAHTFDHWFHWRPGSTRAQFCARVGLDPSRPYLLYLCSSGFICPDERPIVERWLEGLRAHGREPVGSAGVLVRPHPVSGRLWTTHPLGRFENAVVWPPTGADPRNVEAKQDFYDSLYHSAAVVGVNTSAMIEAAIVGRRTFGFRAPELFGGQEGTVHFHYLRQENGGPLTLADSLEQHFEQLEEELSAAEAPAWNASFVASFLRPHGLEIDATPGFADDLEQLAAGVRASAGHPLRAAASLLLYPVAWAVARRDSGKLRAKSAWSRFEGHRPDAAGGDEGSGRTDEHERWGEARRRWEHARSAGKTGGATKEEGRKAKEASRSRKERRRRRVARLRKRLYRSRMRAIELGRATVRRLGP